MSKEQEEYEQIVSVEFDDDGNEIIKVSPPRIVPPQSKPPAVKTEEDEKIVFPLPPMDGWLEGIDEASGRRCLMRKSGNVTEICWNTFEDLQAQAVYRTQNPKLIKAWNEHIAKKRARERGEVYDPKKEKEKEKSGIELHYYDRQMIYFGASRPDEAPAERPRRDPRISHLYPKDPD